MSVNFYTAQGNQSTRTDYEITIDMGKELAMLQKSEKGKQYIETLKEVIEEYKQKNRETDFFEGQVRALEKILEGRK